MSAVPGEVSLSVQLMSKSGVSSSCRRSSSIVARAVVVWLALEAAFQEPRAAVAAATAAIAVLIAIAALMSGHASAGLGRIPGFSVSC